LTFCPVYGILKPSRERRKRKWQEIQEVGTGLRMEHRFGSMVFPQEREAQRSADMGKL